VTGLLSAFLAEVVIVTYRTYSRSGVAGGGLQVPAQAPMNLPLPSYYTAPIIAYGALALVPASGQQFASLVGWGLVVATLLKLWDPTVGTKQVPTLKTTVAQAAAYKPTA
jgi:hypothetical protein